VRFVISDGRSSHQTSSQANLLGSALGLYFAYHLERYYRRRREVWLTFGHQPPHTHYGTQISRLYHPINTEYLSESEDDLEDAGTQLLPTHHHPSKSSKANSTPRRLADVWDEQEEVFGVGADSDEEEVVDPPPSDYAGPPPRIVVTSSEL
jgi:hypothetical protein